MSAGVPVVVDEVSRSFDGQTVVDALSLAVADGEIHGFIGPSGSGKTTTVRLMLGVLAPATGTVRVLDRDPRKLNTAERQTIGYLPQLGVLYPELTVADNLRFMASLYGVRKPKARIAEALSLLDMDGKQSLRLEHASGGMQRRVALAAALLHRPTLLFLDEPTAGLDPVLRRRVWEHFHELQQEGCTLFVTTQIVSEATNCDTVSLIADGALVANGPPDALRRQAEGGDVVDLHVQGHVDGTTVAALEEHPLVLRASRTGADRQTLRIVVADADQAIAEMGTFMADRGLELRLAERYAAPFDDIFVQLMEGSSDA